MVVQRPLKFRVAASGATGLPPLISLNGLLLLVLLLVSHSSRRPRAWPSAMPACDSATNSEIVLPVFDADGKLAAVLDIDSTEPDAFDDVDREGLSAICEILLVA